MLTAALLGALILQGQAGSPGAKEQAPAQVQKLSRAEQQHQKDIDYDTQLGKKYAAEVEKTEKTSEDAAAQERVSRIGQEIAAIAQTTPVDVIWGDKRLNKYSYSFKVLQGKDVNAFSLPGGYVYVYEGLVKYAESDDELAAVLAHEVSHAEERHIATLVHDQQRVQMPALLAIAAAIISRNPEFIQVALIAGTNVVQAFTSGWSIRAEQAADHGGVQYLMHSKYNATAMLTFMERLRLDEHSDQLISGVDWGIYRTHPPARERAEAVLKDLRTYGVTVQRSLVSSRFRTEVKPSRDSAIEIWFNKRKLYTFGGPDALRRAQAAADRLNRFFDLEPNLFDVNFDGKEILGRRSPLIQVLPEDALVDKISTDALGEKAVGAIKGSLYNYAFYIWGSK